MKNKKEIFLEKFVKKDYSDTLEEVLWKKMFPEEVKSLLQDILYKVEVSYNDYETIKKNVLPKEKYIENLIKTIKNNCELINFLKKVNVKTRTYAVNKERKQILCLPIPRKLLYCLAKIQKSENIVKKEPEILNKTLTDTINIGNNINMVEPLRDFNGYSWNISVLEIENCYYNLIYQDLIFLVGNKMLEEWANKYNDAVDYMEMFKLELEKKYNQEIAKEVIQSLKVISLLMEADSNKNFKHELIERKEKVKNELNKMKNKQKYIDDLSKNRKKLIEEIKKIDIILSDKEKLAKEYKNRTEKISMDDKIFNKKILVKELKEERAQKVIEVKNINKKMTSKNFFKIWNDLKYEFQYLLSADTEKGKRELTNQIILFQNIILDTFKIKIEKATTKNQLLKIVYELRYFNAIPLNSRKKISQSIRLKKEINSVEEQAIEKMFKLKMLNEVCKEEKYNIKIVKKLFTSNIIKLEDIHVKIEKGKDEKYNIQYFDGNTGDESFETNLNKEDFKIKINRKVKIFI